MQDDKERHVIHSHFDQNSFIHHTDLCVGSRVALRNWNILPSAGINSGAIGTGVEIVYTSSSEGPNDKDHCHLPDYIVVDFPHLNLPPYIPAWDSTHLNVSTHHRYENT